MMKFRTVVELPDSALKLSVGSRVMLMGSCFAQNIGVRLAAALPDGHTAVNPFGVLYNPLSIAAALSLMADGSFPEAEGLFEGRDGLWHSWYHSGDFSAASREACAEKVAERFCKAADLLRQADLLCLTFGTAHVYELPECGRVVGNCHKEPAARFVQRRAEAGEIAAACCEALERLHRENPALRVVLTVSPYRYAKLGFHGSTLSKAVLHLAAETMAAQLPYVCYFPAYEIVLDELRDYRFFEPDMLHPSQQAADYVWERFREWTFTSQLLEFSKDKSALTAAENHRPLHAEGEAYRHFREQTELRRQEFHAKWDSLVSAFEPGGVSGQI